ncbi:MAG: oxygen-dependent coproporphyrinogen oxidase [Deltaproteobacteria bacterium]|nr:oxygen-dependent coproporphyrinogen oxidase [Deltaproteobacteria bacterium]
MTLMDSAITYFQGLQDRICDALAEIEGASFREDTWQRDGGGGGRSRVLTGGKVFEKAGVNFSDVHGELRPDFSGALPGDGLKFRATGISLVIHPRNPYVPTVHANFRRIERGSVGWFGGGADLTPYYVFAEDAKHFHRTLKTACDAGGGAGTYDRFKAWCDRYFFIAHRNEPRGIGGVFFDYLGAGGEATARETGVPEAAFEKNPEDTFAFLRSVGDAFLPAYLPIVHKHKDDAFGDRERRWQLHRRGRYVEFNLVYDRGTVFGLRTDGRVESILMSLPPEVTWEYNYAPPTGSPEAQSLEQIISRRNWADL